MATAAASMGPTNTTITETTATTIRRSSSKLLTRLARRSGLVSAARNWVAVVRKPKSTPMINSASVAW
jgi:hypothetical protein